MADLLTYRTGTTNRLTHMRPAGCEPLFNLPTKAALSKSVNQSDQRPGCWTATHETSGGQLTKTPRGQTNARKWHRPLVSASNFPSYNHIHVVCMTFPQKRQEKARGPHQWPVKSSLDSRLWQKETWAGTMTWLLRKTRPLCQKQGFPLNMNGSDT